MKSVISLSMYCIIKSWLLRYIYFNIHVNYQVLSFYHDWAPKKNCLKTYFYDWIITLFNRNLKFQNKHQWWAIIKIKTSLQNTRCEVFTMDILSVQLISDILAVIFICAIKWNRWFITSELCGHYETSQGQNTRQSVMSSKMLLHRCLKL